MKKETFNNRTKKVTRNSCGYNLALNILTLPTIQKVRTCWTSGSGRFTTNLDYNSDTIKVLILSGLTQGLDFFTGNDAPKGGKAGNYIILTARGFKKRIK